MKPRIESLFGMKGLALIRAMDWRTSPSRAGKASRAKDGRVPVSSSSWKVSIPQSVWWMRTISLVPSRRCEMVRDRMTSSVTTPPALRMTWASPSASPSTPYGFSRASMQATTAACDAGGSGRSALSKLAAYRPELVTKVSVLLMLPPLNKTDQASARSYPFNRWSNPTYQTRNTRLADAEPAAHRQAQDRSGHDGDHDDADGGDHAEDPSVGGCPQRAPAVVQHQDVGEQDRGDQPVQHLGLHEQLDEVPRDQGDG